MQLNYQNKKGKPVTSVLGFCNININFIFVLVGWESLASNSQVLQYAISRPNGLKFLHVHY